MALTLLLGTPALGFRRAGRRADGRARRGGVLLGILVLPLARPGADFAGRWTGHRCTAC
ncbi:heme exporter protein CcmB [Salmonella enterica]|uniref:heme exporter protein CcmB n=1 Tax=Salmonella enterica TaxID=28901 RepID=UPI003A0FF829